SIVDQPPEDPGHVYMAAFDTEDINHWHLSLFKVDVVTGKGDLMMRAPDSAFQFLMDGHGRPFGIVEQDSNLTNHVVVGGREVGNFDTKGGGSLTFEGLSGDASSALVVEASGRTGTRGLYYWVPPAGVSASLFADQNYDVAETIRDEHTGRI